MNRVIRNMANSADDTTGVKTVATVTAAADQKQA